MGTWAGEVTKALIAGWEWILGEAFLDIFGVPDPNVFSRAEIKALCVPVLQFSHTNIGKPYNFGPQLCARGYCHCGTDLDSLVPETQ